MWAAAIAVILVCGYQYTRCHSPSRYRQSKAVGWNAYFDVALIGSKFLFGGILLASFTVIIMYVIMFMMNVPAYIEVTYTKFTFAYDFFGIRVFGLSMFSFLCLAGTVVVSYLRSSQAIKDSCDPKKRAEIFREIASHSAIESMLLESIEKGLLILITLKSRKVYVGMVDEARFDSLDTSSLVIIPFMSGYRDKDTLMFCVEHNYSDHYQSQAITLTTKPLSVYQFRRILPIDQIESFSLFNVATYEIFQKSVNGDNGSAPT